MKFLSANKAVVHDQKPTVAFGSKFVARHRITWTSAFERLPAAHLAHWLPTRFGQNQSVIRQRVTTPPDPELALYSRKDGSEIASGNPY